MSGLDAIRNCIMMAALVIFLSNNTGITTGIVPVLHRYTHNDRAQYFKFTLLSNGTNGVRKST
jgi:hypothetical protein